LQSRRLEIAGGIESGCNGAVHIGVDNSVESCGNGEAGNLVLVECTSGWAKAVAQEYHRLSGSDRNKHAFLRIADVVVIRVEDQRVTGIEQDGLVGSRRRLGRRFTGEVLSVASR